MNQTDSLNETTETDVVLGKNTTAISNCGGRTMIDAQLSHIADAMTILSPLITAQLTSASNKSCKTWFIEFKEASIYNTDMASLDTNKLAESGSINILLCRKVFLSKIQGMARDRQNIFTSTEQLGIIYIHDYANQRITDEILSGVDLIYYDDSEESKETFNRFLNQFRLIGFNSNAFMIDKRRPHPHKQYSAHYSFLYVKIDKKPMSTNNNINKKNSLDACQSKMNLKVEKSVLQSIVRLFNHSLSQIKEYKLITTSTPASDQLAKDPFNLSTINIVKPPFYQNDERRCWILYLMFAVKIVWLDLGLTSKQTQVAISNVKSSESREMIQKMKSILDVCVIRQAANANVVKINDTPSCLLFGDERKGSLALPTAKLFTISQVEMNKTARN